MNSEHPFHFFYLINETNHIEELKKSFFDKSFDNKYSIEEEWIDTIEFQDSNGIIIREYFKEQIHDIYAFAKISALEKIDSLLLDTNNQDVIKKLSILRSTWNSICEKYIKIKSLSKYQVGHYYSEMEYELNSKLIFLSSRTKQNPYPKGELNFDKLVWTGETITLTTLFYRLYKDDRNNIKPLIETQLENLQKFIHSAFVDSKGEPFSIATIGTYMKPNEIKKRIKRDTDIEPRELLE